jgi:hypothetical protein
LLAVLSVLSACQKPYSIVGKWELYATEANMQIQEMEGSNIFWTFRSDGTFEIKPLDNETEKGTWKQKDNDIITQVKGKKNEEIYNIQEMSADKMTLKLDGTLLSIRVMFKRLD